MWIRIVTSKADPAKVTEIRDLYNSEELTNFFNGQAGHRFHYLLESETEKGDIVFLTAWDSLDEMTTAFASDAHKRVGGRFKPFLVAASERKVYEVR